VDSRRFTSILLNLCNNAIKFAKGHVEVVVPPPSATGGFRCEVHDDGDGVDVDVAPLIFKSGNFGREVSGGTGNDEGNGVGLWSVRKLVNVLQGSCGFSRSPRLGGAMFWFKVPYQPCAPSPTRESILPGQVPQQTPLPLLALPMAQVGHCGAGGGGGSPPELPATSRSGKQSTITLQTAAPTAVQNETTIDAMKFLVVDDCSSVRMAISKILQRSGGHSVDVAVNGQDGLEMVQSAGPGYYDLVLSDVQMPIKGGCEMVQELRAWEASQHESLRRQPVVLMTAQVHLVDTNKVSGGALLFTQRGNSASPLRSSACVLA
jgi:CheY-like chemotaxis protein